MKKKMKCMADGGMPQERPKKEEVIPEWKKSLSAAWQSIAGTREPPKEKPPTADRLGDTANRIKDRSRQLQEIASYANGGMPGHRTGYEAGGLPGIQRDGNSFYGDRTSAGGAPVPVSASPASVATFQAGVKPMAVSTGITPPNMVPTEAQGLAAVGAPTGGALAAAAQQAPIPAATPGNVFANPQAGNMLTPSGGSMTMAEKSRAAGLDPNAAYSAGSDQDPHASGLSGPTAAQRIAGSNASAAALASNQQVPQVSNAIEMTSSRQRRQTATPGLADGGRITPNLLSIGEILGGLRESIVDPLVADWRHGNQAIKGLRDQNQTIDNIAGIHPAIAAAQVANDVMASDVDGGTALNVVQAVPIVKRLTGMAGLVAKSPKIPGVGRMAVDMPATMKKNAIITSGQILGQPANAMADGGIPRTRFEGKGGPRDDQIPVTVAGEKIKVSDGEEAVILPAKTAQNPQAIAAIGQVIEQSNDGRKPAMGMSEGGKYAGGAAPHIVDPRGQVYLNGRPAGLLPAPEIPEYTKPNFYTDSSGGTRAASSARTAVGPYTGPGTAVTPYVAQPQPTPAVQAATPNKGMAYNAGKAVGKAAGKAGGISGMAGSAIKAAVPLVAAYQTFGDDGIKVQGNRASDPNYDETSGMPRVVSSLKEAALRAGDWGTKGLDILGGWALPEGEASFNDAYRQGVGQLEGVSAPTSQQVAAQTAQKQIASAPQATYSNEGRPSAIQTTNNTPDPRIAQNTGNAGDARVDPASGNLHFTQKGFDPTQQQFAPGSGAITDPKTGRTILVAPQAIAQAPDNAPRDRHGNDMTQTLALRDELNRARADRAWQNMNSPTEGYRQQGMAQLQALAQIGALDTESMKRLGIQQSNAANLPEADKQLKGQAIAQGGMALQQANELNALYAAHNAEQNPDKRSMIAEQIRVRTGKDRQDKPIAVDMGETISADGMMKAKNPNVLYDPSTRQTIQLNGGQSAYQGFTKSEVDAAIKAGASKEAVIARIKSMGKNPKDYGL